MTPEQAAKAADKMNLQGPMREAFLRRAQATAAPAAAPAPEAAPVRIAPVAQPKPVAPPRPAASRPPPAFQPVPAGGMVQPETVAQPGAYAPDYTAKPWATMDAAPMEREKPPGANSPTPPPMMPPETTAYRMGRAVGGAGEWVSTKASQAVDAAGRAAEALYEANKRVGEQERVQVQRDLEAGKRENERAAANLRAVGGQAAEFAAGVRGEPRAQPAPPPPKSPSTASAPPVLVRPTKPAAPAPPPEPARPAQPSVEEMMNVMSNERGYSRSTLDWIRTTYGDDEIAKAYAAGVTRKPK